MFGNQVSKTKLIIGLNIFESDKLLIIIVKKI